MNKKIIPIIILLFIITTIFIFVIVSKHYKNENEDSNQISYKVERVTLRNEFYNINGCISKFYTFYSYLYNEEVANNIDCVEEDLEQDLNNNIGSKMIYSLLDEKYLSLNGITEDNLKIKFKKIDDVSVDITDMYVCKKDNNIATYFAYGKLVNKSDYSYTEFSTMLNVDIINKTFSIYPQDYVEKSFKDIKEGEIIKLDIPDKIENKVYNIFDYKDISDVRYIEMIFKQYIKYSLCNPQLAYEKLEERCRNERFGNIDNYKQYIKENTKRLVIAKLDKYNVTKYDDYIEYFVIDNKGNKYRFKEYSPNKYDLVLEDKA